MQLDPGLLVFVVTIGKATIAGVCRNFKGDLVDGFCKHVTCDSPICGEALAVSETLKLAKSAHFTSLVVETDCLSLVQAINNENEPASWAIAAIVDQIRLLLSLFCFVGAVYVHRLADRVGI